MSEHDPDAEPDRSPHRAPPPATPQPGDDALTGPDPPTDDDAGESLAATNRLAGEFAPLADFSTVAQVVRTCWHDLRGAPAGALPELVERLARQRLHEHTGLDPGPDLPPGPESR